MQTLPGLNMMRPRGPKPPWLMEQEAMNPVAGPMFEGAAPDESIHSFDQLGADLQGAGVSQLRQPAAPSLPGLDRPKGSGAALATPDAAGNWSTLKRQERLPGIFMPNDKGVWETKAAFPEVREEQAKRDAAAKEKAAKAAALEERGIARREESADLDLEGKRNKVRGVLTGADKTMFDEDLLDRQQRRQQNVEKLQLAREQGATDKELKMMAIEMQKQELVYQRGVQGEDRAEAAVDRTRRRGREDTVWAREDKAAAAAPSPQDLQAMQTRSEMVKTVLQEVMARPNLSTPEKLKLMMAAQEFVKTGKGGEAIAPGMPNTVPEALRAAGAAGITDEAYDKRLGEAEDEAYGGNRWAGKAGRFLATRGNPLGMIFGKQAFGATIDEPVKNMVAERLAKDFGIPLDQAVAFVAEKYGR